MRVVVNAAASADGKLSTRHRDQVAISGENDFDRVAALRASVDAVMVGAGTVQADDPHLVLDAERQRQRRDRGESATPARVVADSKARLPPDARIFDDSAETFVLVSEAAPRGRVERFRHTGARVVVAGDRRVDLAAAFAELEARGIDETMVEGGGELIFSLFEAGLVDELSVFVGATVVGGRDAPTLADGRGFDRVEDFVDLSLADVERIDDGVLLRWHVVDD